MLKCLVMTIISPCTVLVGACLEGPEVVAAVRGDLH